MKKNFTAMLVVYDGGEPISIICDEDGARIERGEETVGEGETLLQAWNDYLYKVPEAPVGENDLETMWERYEAWLDAGNT